MSCGVEADGLNEHIKTVDDPVIEPVQLRSFFTLEPGIAAHGAEKACGQRRVNALEELQENEANRVSTIRNIGEAAKLTVRESGSDGRPRYTPAE